MVASGAETIVGTLPAGGSDERMVCCGTGGGKLRPPPGNEPDLRLAGGGGGTVERDADEPGGAGKRGAGGIPIMVRGRLGAEGAFFCKSSNTSKSDPGGLGGFLPS